MKKLNCQQVVHASGEPCYLTLTDAGLARAIRYISGGRTEEGAL